jgi:ElaB/YqjD/DUF883 family membrane-anchored ribosome-binding protein
MRSRQGPEMRIALSSLEDHVMATVKQDIRHGAEELGNTAHEAAADARGEFRRLGEQLRSNGADLGDELTDAGERFVEGARRFGDAAAEQIREHPLAAFGVAFTAGVMLTRLLRHR